MNSQRTMLCMIIVLLLTAGLIIPANADMSPNNLIAELAPGESVSETKTVLIPSVPPRADVVFAFDLTGSMGGIINTAKSQANNILLALDALPGVDTQYGVVSYMDYPGCYASCGYSSCYGYASYGDYAYSLDQAVTADTAAITSAINALVLGYGGDGPQDYTRIMYESYADPNVSWRSGARRILVNFGDNVPHDCNLNEGVTGGTWTTGGDPGRDGIIGTSDDLDLQTVLGGMAANGVILLECHTAPYYSGHWTYWTGLTGGGLYITNSSTLVNDIVTAVQGALEIPVVNGLHLEASPGFQSWLASVVPASYDGLVPGDSVEFDLTITVPDGTPGGVYNFTISAVDGLGVSYGDQDVSITVVTNQPPTADANGPYSGDEGSAIPLDGTASSDPDGDPLTFSWSVDSGLCSFDDATIPSPNLTCTDNGDFTVTLVVDDGQATNSNTAAVTVYNVAPTVSIDSVAPTLVAVGEPVAAAGSFTDPGTNDTHTAVWNWGDTTTSPGTVSALSVGPDSHVYSVAGIYTIQLTVTDDDLGAGTAAYQFVVVYDPSAGFVTGGGWIDSPAGAYTADPSIVGKATFGFVSKYKKGATVPEGNTEFQFHAAGLNFHSNSYEWLVVTGSNYARFKGVGTINGEGEYKFMLWAGDDEPDTFRIKIWTEDEFGVETVVYDNGFDQAIGGGSIVIHTKN